MDKAIDYAKEILNIQNAVEKSNSEDEKRGYRKTITRQVKELMFYCLSQGISLNDVMIEANNR